MGAKKTKKQNELADLKAQLKTLEKKINGEGEAPSRYLMLYSSSYGRVLSTSNLNELDSMGWRLVSVIDGDYIRWYFHAENKAAPLSEALDYIRETFRLEVAKDGSYKMVETIED